MLQQAQRVSGRSAAPVLKWMERCAEGAASTAHGHKLPGLKTLQDMPGPSVGSFAWDLFAKRGLSRLHDLQVKWLRLRDFLQGGTDKLHQAVHVKHQ